MATKRIDYREHISSDPRICHGAPVIRGTRVLLSGLLASLAEGDTVQDLLASYPTLREEDVQAVVAFAAASAVEDLPATGLPW